MRVSACRARWPVFQTLGARNAIHHAPNTAVRKRIDTDLRCVWNAVTVDVRGPDEFHGPLGHVANVLNLPVGELPQRLMEINALKGKPIILICCIDKRSATATALFRLP